VVFNKLTKCTLVFLLLLSSGVYADTHDDLYTVDILVAQQTKNIPAKIITEALRQVVVRVSGNQSIIEKPQIQEQLQHGETLIKQYSYQQYCDANTDAVKNNLHIEFVAENIDQLILKAGHDVWDAERPMILLVVVIKDDDHYRILANDDQTPIRQYIAEVAKKRGLKVTFPLMDLEDLEKLMPLRILRQQAKDISETLRRYAATTLVTVKIDQDEQSQWVAEWRLSLNQHYRIWHVTSASLEELANTGLNNVADGMATTLARNTQPSHELVHLRVVQVNTANDYIRVLYYLQRLGHVKRVEIIDLMPGIVDYQVEIDSSKAKLMNAIAQKSIFINTDVNNMNNDQLRYQLVS